MQTKLGTMLSLKRLFLPRNNHWQKRTILVFTFILFDYLSTLVFCRAPYEEANLYARTFMETFGIPLGLTAFVLAANLPIYITLSLDSHVIKIPLRTAKIIEPFVDTMFAWFVAGLHFSGGASWFWHAPSLVRQISGAFLYLAMAFLFVKPHKPCYYN
jgi:uncharacterized membrane protein